MKTRVEKDTMGAVKVPVDALYGAQTQRAIDNFNRADPGETYASVRIFPDLFIISLAQIKKAAAQTNFRLGCLSPPQANAIIRACDQVIAGRYLDQFPVSIFQTGSGTSTNMNMNEVLATLANRALAKRRSAIRVHPNDQVNYGQSSNDVIPSSLQLALLSSIVTQVLPAVTMAENRLAQLSREYKQVIKTARTHLMDAVPLALGDELATWRHRILEGKKRLESTLPRLSQLPLGGTAVGTGINRHKDFAKLAAANLAELTGLPVKPCADAATRISAQDPAQEVHSQLKLLATVLMKIANDLRWMNSGPNAGLAEIQLKALQPGSSIMPGKVNPVIPESIAMMCAEVLGNDVTVTLANQSGNFQLNVMLPLIADKCLHSAALMSDALRALAGKGLEGLTVNREQLASVLALNPTLATALNTRIGYEKAAEIAKTAQREKRSVLDVALEKTTLDREELERLLDPKKQARPFAK